MPVPFLVKVHSDRPQPARELADALRRSLDERGARYTLDVGPRGLPGACVSVGIMDPLGLPRWLAPLPVEGAPERAAREVVSFLESWGFVARAAVPRAS